MSSKIQQIIEIITKGAGKSEKQVKGVSGALGGLAKQAGVAAAAYFGTRALLNGIKSSIDLFGKQELAEKKLEAALGRTSPALLKQARALQQVSMFGDEVIIEAQALIGSFVKEESAIKAATKATLDLAAAKGMELTVAADLVSKTLGSSTNALSRYGIEVTGAVGSTERLESLTNNLADVFGGQATAQTDTFAGSMAQLSNAFGDLQEDLGEKLAPSIRALADGFKNLITESPADQTKKERFEFERLTDVLIDAETSQSSRNKAISELQSKYSDYIGNINLEKTTTEELVKMQKQSINQMLQRIELQVREEKITQLMRERFELEDELFTLEANKTEGHFKNLGGMTRVYVEGSEKKIASKNKEIEQVEKEIERITDLSKAHKDINQEVVAGSFFEFDNEDENAFATYQEAMFNKMVTDEVARQKEEEALKLRKQFIETYPEEAKQLGLVTKEMTEREKTLKILGDLSKGESKATARVSQVNAIINTAEAITEFIAKGSFGKAALAGIMGAKQINTIESSISKYATGADYVTSGPEMIMVGDNPSGREHIQVTPLGGDPNINGPQGGMTINIQGSVIGTEQFTEDVLMPQIEEGLRLGNRI